MTGHDLKHDITGNQSTLTFPGKPSPAIRAALKNNRYRWSPSGGYWWKSGATGSADFAAHLRVMLDREAGIRRPDAPCWKCKDPAGFLRARGAAAPVYCDACNAADLKAEDDHRNAPDGFDLLVEDSYRDRCGL